MKILTDQHRTLRWKLGNKHGISWEKHPKLDSAGRSLTSTGVDYRGRKVKVSTHWDGGRDVYDRVPSKYLGESTVLKAIGKIVALKYKSKKK